MVVVVLEVSKTCHYASSHKQTSIFTGGTISAPFQALREDEEDRKRLAPEERRELQRRLQDWQEETGASGATEGLRVSSGETKCKRYFFVFQTHAF